MDLHHVVIDNGYVTHVQSTGIQETVESLRVVKGLKLGFVEALTKLAPHGIEHHFGQGAEPRVLLDFVVLQPDAFMLEVILDIFLFLVFGVDSLGPSTGFLLDFQPGVDVIFEEPLAGLVKMPDLVDVLDLVPELDGFGQFRGAPCPRQGALVVGVMAFGGSVPGTFGHFVLHTRCTEGKQEFAVMAVRQDRMVQFTRRQDLTLDEAKVLVDVGVTGGGDETRMSLRVDTGFVDPWVQRGHIDVMDLLSGGDMVIQLDGIGTPSTERVAWIQGCRELKLGHKRPDIRGGVFETSPFTFPHLNDRVPELFEPLDPLLGGLVDILHGPIKVAYMGFVAVWITRRASMGETPLKFVHGPGVVAVPIHEANRWDPNFTGIAHMLDAQFLATPGEPFHGDAGLVDGVAPTTDGFTGDAVGDHTVHA